MQRTVGKGKGRAGRPGRITARREFRALMRGLGSVLLLCVLPFPDLPGQRGRNWNVVLITVDTLRADRLPLYGYRNLETPSIDQLARRGTVFRHAVAPTPLTLPSHASILTGTYPLFHGIQDNAGFVLSPAPTTLAEALSAAGLVSGAFVGSFVLDRRFGLDRGFTTYRSDFPLSGLEVVAPDALQKRAGEVAAAAQEWMQERSRNEERFFCWIHFYDPHTPYDPPEPYASRYRQTPYDGEIAYVDSVIGSLLDFLQKESLQDRTLIVLTSDHGESLGQHGEETHGYFIYEATQHVPLIWVHPDGSLAGRQVTGTVRLIDIAPTLLQVLGIPIPGSVQGNSLYRALLGRETLHLDAYAETFYPRLQFGWSELRAFYRGPYKYIEAPQPELYKLDEDPREQVNLWESQRSLAHALQEELRKTTDRFSAPQRHPGSEAAVDAELTAALRSLGYLALSAGTLARDRSYMELPDPKEKIEVYNRITRAHGLVRAGRLEAAVEEYQAILRQDPQAQFVYHPLGMAYARLGRYRQALGAYRKAAQAFPGDSQLLFNLGSAHLRLQEWKEAEEAFQKVVDIDPGHFRARNNLASLWLQSGRFEEALQASETILKTHPDYEPALFNAGLCWAALNQRQKAIQYLERVLEINPRNLAAMEYLARFYAEEGQADRSETYRSRARALQENRP